MEFDVAYDQALFHAVKDMVDWGVLVSEGLGGDATVCVVALTPDDAAKMLRGAADAIEAADGG